MATSAPSAGQTWPINPAQAFSPSSNRSNRSRQVVSHHPAAVGISGISRDAAIQTSIANDLNQIRSVQVSRPAIEESEHVRSGRISPSKPRRHIDRNLLLSIRAVQLQKRPERRSSDRSVKAESSEPPSRFLGPDLSSTRPASAAAASLATGSPAVPDAGAGGDDEKKGRRPLSEKRDWFQLAVRGRKAKIVAQQMESSTSPLLDGSDAAEHRSDAVKTAVAPAAATAPADSASSDLSLSGLAGLQTEVMGPPPQLPQDAAYPPLDPMAEYLVPVPVGNKKKPAAPPPMRPTAPEDYVAPVGRHGKMPYGLALAVQEAEAKKSSKAKQPQPQQQQKTAATPTLGFNGSMLQVGRCPPPRPAL
ncbi:uncharacterized protein PFL1_05813 [Pseudozyma flocculosa PF-1]|uniref:Uncharacterized protein n=1 Tax=Pseudozyma flocculosa PF-1 TaxID=1277687 RepID=A0A061H7D1_9BASI|nr:uncharacterized protein PFL1_05813 [Pseudozyma flocculosa PF-1]EPQ26491.1 hypothetical protein PFL1_05813 [Pseudozyma flocculosa PF-1]